VRIVLMMLGAFVSVGLFSVGATSVLVGIAEEGTDDHVYDVVFVRDVEPCDENELYLSIEDGEALSCGVGLSMATRVDLPGFTEAQNDEVGELADQLGIDGLTGAEQHQIQDRVDELLATVPRARRGDYHPGIWGARRAWLGLSMVLASVLGMALALILGTRGATHS